MKASQADSLVLAKYLDQSSSLERIVPDRAVEDHATGGLTLSFHLERYEFAARHCRPGRFLDAGCGVGYGTRHIVEHSTVDLQGVGIDIDGAAVEYAKRRYLHPRISFAQSDVATFFSPMKFDSIVALEVIEHVHDPEDFVLKLLGNLKPDGCLIASAPVTPSVDINPHHTTDFTPARFRLLFSRFGLIEVDSLSQRQPVPIAKILRRSESRMSDMRQDLLRFYFANPRSLIRRVVSTLRFGFANLYLTTVWVRRL